MTDAPRNPPRPAAGHGRSISDQLREAIQRSGLTGYALAAEAGVHRIMISRFLSGERSLSLDTVDRLAAVLKLKLVADGRRSKPR